MAIDTEGRRRSTVVVLPVPDGTVAQADRQQATWHYSGILVATGVTTVGIISLEGVAIGLPRLASVSVGLPNLALVIVSTPYLDSVEVRPG